jgi:hypothetical protein
VGRSDLFSERSAGNPIGACKWSHTMPGRSQLAHPTFPDQFLEGCRSQGQRISILLNSQYFGEELIVKTVPNQLAS